MMIFLQNKRLNQFVILLICMFPSVLAAQGIEEALQKTKNTVEEKKEAEPAAESAAEPAASTVERIRARREALVSHAPAERAAVAHGSHLD